jgi:menaquinol-cytochrome c reductase cytochrome b/c subunit
MNRQEKEQYLREYEVMKKKGKPFFPYAIMKDSVMALIVVGVIVFMSLWLGAEQGPKADPTTTTYVPRPEWYFFFLFEVLRVIKPNELVPVATIGIPTICMVLLLLLPFYDRNPERNPLKRPIATVAGLLTIVSMAFLTFLGAEAGSPTQIDIDVGPQYEAGKLVAAQSGCLACHQFEHNGNAGPGPQLTEIGARLPAPAIARSLEIGPDIMPSYAGLKASDPDKFKDLVLFLASLTGEESGGGSESEQGASSDGSAVDNSVDNPTEAAAEDTSAGAADSSKDADGDTESTGKTGSNPTDDKSSGTSGG